VTVGYNTVEAIVGEWQGATDRRMLEKGILKDVARTP
jgi:hypothetical protein